jgi:hypothetical protein
MRAWHILPKLEGCRVFVAGDLRIVIVVTNQQLSVVRLNIEPGVDPIYNLIHILRQVQPSKPYS